MGGGRDGGLQIVSDKILYPMLERRPSCVCVRFSQGMITLIIKSTKTTTCSLKRLLFSSCSLPNVAAFSQRRRPRSHAAVVEYPRWGDRGISRCYCADWLLSSCVHRISRSSGQSAWQHWRFLRVNK